MQLKKVFLPLSVFIGIVILFFLFAISVKSQNSRLQSNKDLTAALHKMRFSLASSSEALSNAVLSKSDANAEKFGRDALQKIEDFKSARQQVEKGLEGTDESRLLQEIDRSFARFEEVCDKLVQSSKQNSNRKAYALAVGPSLDLMKKLDGGLAHLLETSGDAQEESRHLRSIEVYESRLALLRIQSIIVRHIFEASDGVMDLLESELQSELSRIKSSLSSPHLVPNRDDVEKIADISSQLKEFENCVAEIIVLSRQNSNVHAEDIATTTRIEATLDCETKLNEFEQTLHKQLDSLRPKGRGE